MENNEITIEQSNKLLHKLVDSNYKDLLQGTLPKVLKYRFQNMGFKEETAKMIVDVCVRKANEFSHYKIGGKYCKENKNQNY